MLCNRTINCQQMVGGTVGVSVRGSISGLLLRDGNNAVKNQPVTEIPAVCSPGKKSHGLTVISLLRCSTSISFVLPCTSQ
jgi:hypothetical protein